MAVNVIIQETVNDVTVNATVQTVDVTVDISDVASDLSAANAQRAEDAAVASEGFRDEAEGFAQQTALDAIATAADRVQTGLDVIAANDAKTDAENARDEIPILLENFFDPAIIALNSRIVAEGATVIRKLYIIQLELGELLNEI